MRSSKFYSATVKELIALPGASSVLVGHGKDARTQAEILAECRAIVAVGSSSVCCFSCCGCVCRSGMDMLIKDATPVLMRGR